MIKRSFLKIYLYTSLFLIISVSLFAQSSYTRHGQNGVLFDLQTALNPDNVIGEAGGRLGLSIGGVLDIGADFTVTNSEIESEDSRETNIGIRYGVMVLKQENRSPVSLTLGGTYGYSFVESDYYADQDLQKEGQGYSLEMELVKDFLLGSKVQLRLGGFGEFRSYNYTILDVSQATVDDRTSAPARETRYSYGGIVSFGIKTRSGAHLLYRRLPEPGSGWRFIAADTQRNGF